MTSSATLNEMIHVAGGEFRMGTDDAYPEEGPARLVRVAAFWIDRHAVTNRAFARFVRETGYVTVAERQVGGPMTGGLVFRDPGRPVDLRDASAWWRFAPGASWRCPDGQPNGIEGREHDPVVQVTHEDARAFASWSGKRLPTEAEWEFAARGGLHGAIYCWGDDVTPDGRWMANTWQGAFPWENTRADGFSGRAPVGSFPPNGFGLFDMAGNVWQWTSDDFAPRHGMMPGKSCCAPDARRDKTIPRKVIKGGSYLCAPNYCLRYRPAARQGHPANSATCHIGFRCARG